MVQFMGRMAPVRVVAEQTMIDDATWSAIRRALGPQLEHEYRSSLVMEGPAGGQICVVVVERQTSSGDVLPSARELRHRFSLTPREAEVALLAAERLSIADMAAALKISINTTRHHVERVLSKLRVARRSEIRGVLVQHATRQRELAARAEVLEAARRERRLRAVA